MSQVDYEFHEAPIEEYIDRIMPSNGHILIAEHTNVNEIYFEKIFPKETHCIKKEETIYTESIHKYQIKEIIKSDKFKKDEIFWIWQEPNYSLSDIREYHESGLSRSPVILERRPKYPIKSEQFIVFIKLSDKKNENHPEIYTIITIEGIEAEKEIIEIMNKKKKQWWQFWK